MDLEFPASCVIPGKSAAIGGFMDRNLILLAPVWFPRSELLVVVNVTSRCVMSICLTARSITTTMQLLWTPNGSSAVLKTCCCW